MNQNSFREISQKISLGAWGAVAFCLPFSTALCITFSAIGVLFALMGMRLNYLKVILRSPVALCCVALFVWMFLSVFWSVAPSGELLEGLSKYRKLLYVPLIASIMLATNCSPLWLLRWFSLGCTVVALGSLASSSGLIELLIGPQNLGVGWGIGGSNQHHWFYIGPPEYPTFGRSWIASGAFLVCSSVYWYYKLFDELSSGKRLTKPTPYFRIGILFFVLTVTLYAVANMGGRTGYALYIICVITLAFKFRQLGFLKSAVRTLLGGLALALIFSAANPRVSERVIGAVDDVHRYSESGEQTSQGLRLRFWEVGLIKGFERPLTGWGVGSYAEVLARDGSQPMEVRLSRAHPHSEFVLMFVQGGLVAFVLLLGIVFLVFSSFALLNRQSIGLLPILLAPMLLLVSGGFNSVLWDLGEGHALGLFLGALVATQASHTPVNV